MKATARDQLVQKLRVARHRLQAALDKFYSHDLHGGDHIAMEAAALDFSTAIRVLVHTDKSLLAQLDADYWDKLIHFKPLIAPPPQPDVDGRPTRTSVIPVNLTFRTKTTSFTRYRGNEIQESKAPLKNWWFDTCWDNFGHNLSNKDMVLALANKEGGTHVDAGVSAKYKAAKEQGRLVMSGKPVSDVVRLGNLVGVAGDELLEYLQVYFPESA